MDAFSPVLLGWGCWLLRLVPSLRWTAENKRENPSTRTSTVKISASVTTAHVPLPKASSQRSLEKWGWGEQDMHSSHRLWPEQEGIQNVWAHSTIYRKAQEKRHMVSDKWALPREQARSYHTGADFWSRDRFILLKTVGDSKGILFLWVISIDIEKLKPINALNIF